jgi:hypothetical protein
VRRFDVASYNCLRINARVDVRETAASDCARQRSRCDRFFSASGARRLVRKGLRIMPPEVVRMRADNLGLVGFLLSASMCLVLVGCASPQTTGEKTVSFSSEGGPTAQSHADMAIGTTADYGGLRIIVLSAGTGPTASDGRSSLDVKVRYENDTKQTASYNEFDWSVQDSSGARRQGMAMFDTNPETLGSGELAPGEVAEGDIYISGGAGARKVIYAPSMSSGEQEFAKWTVK